MKTYTFKKNTAPVIKTDLTEAEIQYLKNIDKHIYATKKPENK